jgi:hypothetical protein
MRPMFADTIVTEAGIDLDLVGRDGPEAHAEGRSDRRARAADYREWRRTRVLFMQSVSEAERAVVPGVADLPAQRRRADL